MPSLCHFNLMNVGLSEWTPYSGGIFNLRGTRIRHAAARIAVFKS